MKGICLKNTMMIFCSVAALINLGVEWQNYLCDSVLTPGNLQFSGQTRISDNIVVSN